MEELYRKYRPQTFDEVVGQGAAVKMLRKYLEKGKVPHAIMFCGPSGVGKTTMARILAKELQCSAIDFQEINAAETRGIDTVREIADRANIRPMDGPVRVLILDEAHQLTKRAGGDAQTALLKVLEEAPAHAYYFLPTTDPGDLLKTIHTRCTKVFLSPLSPAEMEDLLYPICKKEKVKIGKEVIEKIIECAEGGARQALVLLDSVVYLDGDEERLESIIRSDTKRKGIDLARALHNERTKWPEVAAILKDLDDEPETVRKIVLGYANAVLLNSGKGRAYLVIQCFRDPFFHDGKVLLTSSCFEVIGKK